MNKGLSLGLVGGLGYLATSRLQVRIVDDCLRPHSSMRDFDIILLAISYRFDILDGASLGSTKV